MSKGSETQRGNVVIVGGGMVGATLACALGDAGLQVDVIESKPSQRTWAKQGFDQRVSAITRASQRIFEALGVWQGMLDRRVSPYEHMHVWDASGDGVIHFDCSEIGEPNLGFIIENRVIEASLYERMESMSNVNLICPAKATQIIQTDETVRLVLHGGETLEAKLLVGADGARSWVREQMGIGLRRYDYQQTALIATVKTTEHHRYTAWQRFLSSGPLALLPLTDGYCSIVWSTSTAEADRLLTMDEEAFLASLTHASEGILGAADSVSGRVCLPLVSQHARQYFNHRAVLVGDAAHTIHPLAGQGANLGLADAAVLAELIIAANEQHADFASVKILRRYERWRRADNSAMQNAMTGFKALFGNNLPLVRQARNAGLNLVDRMNPAKNFCMRYAMGLTGDLPRLARGGRLG
jgi:2-octaprenylphenol hydroxylase